MSAHANVVRDLLAMLGYDHATVVGQSFGGSVAMQFAYQYPERCERLALVVSGGLGPEVNPLLRGLSVPGMEQLFPLVCSPWLRDAGARLAGLATRLGLPGIPVECETIAVQRDLEVSGSTNASMIQAYVGVAACPLTSR